MTRYAPSGYPAVPPPRPTVPADRIVTAIALVIGAGLTVGGSFLVLAYQAATTHGRPVFHTTFTAWGYTVTFGPGINESRDPGHSPLFGISLVIAAALALAVAVRVLVTLRRPAPARTGVLIAGSFLIGVNAAVFLYAEGVSSVYGTSGNEALTAGYGAGTWLLVVAALVALIAVLSALTPRRPSPPRPPAAVQ